jgi:hypothetical protein
MDVNGHERLSNIIFIHTLKWWNISFIAVLYYAYCDYTYNYHVCHSYIKNYWIQNNEAANEMHAFLEWIISILELFCTVLLVEETGVPWENHRPVTSYNR